MFYTECEAGHDLTAPGAFIRECEQSKGKPKRRNAGTWADKRGETR